MLKAYQKGPGAKGASRYVARLEICRGRPFYGYTKGWKAYIKLSFFSPAYVNRCATLFSTGGITGFLVQTFESHIPYLLAFLADYNLYGCNWIDLSKYTLRPANGEPAIALTSLELDAPSTSILNRAAFQIEALPLSSAPVPKVNSLRELRDKNEALRLGLGVPIYSQNLSSAFPTQLRSHDDNWEFQHDYNELWEQRKDENLNGTAFFEPTSGGADHMDLPTVSELIPAAQAEGLAVDHLGPGDAYMLFSKAKKRKSVREESLNKSQKAGRHVTFSPSSFGSIDSADLTQTLHSLSQEAHAPQEDTLVLKCQLPSRSDVDKKPGFTMVKKPFYSKKSDIPDPAFSYGGVVFEHKRGNDGLSDFSENTADFRLCAENKESCWQELRSRPPSRAVVDQWASSTPVEKAQTQPSFTIPTITPSGQRDILSVLALEVFVPARPNFTPVPSTDPITAIFWRYLASDVSRAKDCRGVISTESLVFGVGPKQSSDEDRVQVVDNEVDLFPALHSILRELDPDVLCGYETSGMSWGYVSARYSHYFNSKMDFGRISDSNTMRELPFNAEIASRGRHLLNLWDLLRKEVALLKYTLEFVVLHMFHETTPYLDYQELTSLWRNKVDIAGSIGLGSKFDNGRLALRSYFDTRLDYQLLLLDNLEIISKFSAHSRVIGIDFMSSITRGSQFQVEAMMTRLSKREEYILISPSRKQVGQQNALEFIPLVMEPKSAFYADPVCVLDFRSLYPSIIIAYNLCYTTFLSRLRPWRGKNKMGFVDDLLHPKGLLQELEKDIYIAPNGIAYVQENVRKSLIAQMLNEILESRFMLKDSLKLKTDDARFQRNVNNQQKALKYIANVTYGYTSASFSGRMPCSELADSIVLTGREILVRAVQRINEFSKYKHVQPEVVYGDTDSLFVKLPGCTVEQAWKLGGEIAEMVTASNRSPIVLEHEKVYDGCILVTKKRYVGNALMSPAANSPKLDAKGIETIRRDGTPIEQKIEKGALELFFRSRDLSLLKSYLTKQWRDIMAGNVLLQDFCFAREVKLGHYSENATTAQLPGGAIVSLQRIAKDPGGGPQYRERVPFIVAAGPPGSRIADRCFSPQDAMKKPGSINVDVNYYITKNIIPPLERLFNLAGANVKAWYEEMPRSIRYNHSAAQGHDNLRSFLRNQSCSVCLNRCDSPLCGNCLASAAKSLFIIENRLAHLESRSRKIGDECRKCTKGVLSTLCKSLDCANYYKREQANIEVRSQQAINEEALDYMDTQHAIDETHNT